MEKCLTCHSTTVETTQMIFIKVTEKYFTRTLPDHMVSICHAAYNRYVGIDMEGYPSYFK